MSYNFTDVNDVITDGTDGGASLDILTYSLMAWVKVGNISSSTGHVMGRSTGTHTENHMLMRLPASNADITQHVFRQGFPYNYGYAQQDGSTLQYGVGLSSWDVIIGTYDSATIPRFDAYINGGGSFLYGGETGANVVNQPFSIGRVNDNSERSFNGLISHVAVWNRVLTSQEITDLSNGGNPQTVASTGLIRYWPLTANSSTQADEMGSGHDLTVYGATYSTDDPLVGQTQLATPSNFSFSSASSSLQVDGSWNPVADAATYDWEVEENSLGSWVAFQNGNTASTSFQLTGTDGLAWSTSYRARVRAVA